MPIVFFIIQGCNSLYFSLSKLIKSKVNRAIESRETVEAIMPITTTILSLLGINLTNQSHTLFSMIYQAI